MVMVRRIALVMALTVCLPMVGSAPVRAQDAAEACASALWLPARADEDGIAATAVAQITEPAPAWMTIELTDACSGETFALTDLAGHRLYIEPMATWCVNCREQLTRATEAFSRLPEAEREHVVLVALSSEVGLPVEDLAAYAASTKFPFIFAVMPEEMLKAMADDLGQEIAVPPATPHLIVAADGAVGELHVGGASVEELLALLTEAEDNAAS